MDQGSIEIDQASIQKDLKQLSKKYRRVYDDIEGLKSNLKANPQIGDLMPGMRAPCRKLRLASSDISKGKSGGFRVITFLSPDKEILYILMVYSKTEYKRALNKKILERLKRLEESQGPN